MTTFGKIARAAQLYRENGASGIGSALAERLRRAVGRLTPEETAWRDRKLSMDATFDRLAGAGVDTAGVQHLYDLSIAGPNARFGVDHIASDPEDFARAVGALPADLRDATFVDLGSGKARAILMAARLPFKAIVGVEFAAELHAIAVANVATLPEDDRSRIQLVHGDASEYTLPQGELVIYLYHPFGLEMMRSVAAKAMAEIRKRPRQAFVIYVNPVHANAWTDAGWRKAGFGQSYMIFRFEAE